jgi:hypothetical protein
MGRTVSNPYSQKQMWQAKVMRPSSFKPDCGVSRACEASRISTGLRS